MFRGKELKSIETESLLFKRQGNREEKREDREKDIHTLQTNRHRHTHSHLHSLTLNKATSASPTYTTMFCVGD